MSYGGYGGQMGGYQTRTGGPYMMPEDGSRAIQRYHQSGMSGGPGLNGHWPMDGQPGTVVSSRGRPFTLPNGQQGYAYDEQVQGDHYPDCPYSGMGMGGNTKTMQNAQARVSQNHSHKEIGNTYKIDTVNINVGGQQLVAGGGRESKSGAKNKHARLDAEGMQVNRSYSQRSERVTSLMRSGSRGPGGDGYGGSGRGGSRYGGPSALGGGDSRYGGPSGLDGDGYGGSGRGGSRYGGPSGMGGGPSGAAGDYYDSRDGAPSRGGGGYAHGYERGYEHEYRNGKSKMRSFFNSTGGALTRKSGRSNLRGSEYSTGAGVLDYPDEPTRGRSETRSNAGIGGTMARWNKQAGSYFGEGSVTNRKASKMMSALSRRSRAGSSRYPPVSMANRPALEYGYSGRGRSRAASEMGRGSSRYGGYSDRANSDLGGGSRYSRARSRASSMFGGGGRSMSVGPTSDIGGGSRYSRARSRASSMFGSRTPRAPSPPSRAVGTIHARPISRPESVYDGQKAIGFGESYYAPGGSRASSRAPSSRAPSTVRPASTWEPSTRAPSQYTTATRGSSRAPSSQRGRSPSRVSGFTADSGLSSRGPSTVRGRSTSRSSKPRSILKSFSRSSSSRDNGSIRSGSDSRLSLFNDSYGKPRGYGSDLSRDSYADENRGRSRIPGRSGMGSGRAPPLSRALTRANQWAQRRGEDRAASRAPTHASRAPSRTPSHRSGHGGDRGLIRGRSRSGSRHGGVPGGQSRYSIHRDAQGRSYREV